MVGIDIHGVVEIKVLRYIHRSSRTSADYYSMTLEILNTRKERTEITFYGNHSEEPFNLKFEIPEKAIRSN